MATYQRIFPGLFKPFAAMSVDLRQHIRYPEHLFYVQAHVYRAYHMPILRRVLQPRRPVAIPPRDDRHRDRRRDAEMAPYVSNMRFPGETHAEFILMLPMVPAAIRI